MTTYVLKDASSIDIHIVPGDRPEDEREAMVVCYPNGYKMFLWSDGTFQIQNGNSLTSPGVELTEHNIVDAHNNKTPVAGLPNSQSPPKRKKAKVGSKA